MTTPITRLVPKPPFDRSQAEALADKSGWTLHSSNEADEGHHPFEMIWLSADRGAAVHWVEDDEYSRVHYLLVEGPQPGPTLDLLHHEVDVYDDASLVDLFDVTRDGVALMNALRVLGIHCAGPLPFNTEMFALFRWALNDPEPLVRRLAVHFAGFSDWEEFDALFEYLRDHDPMAEVRESARSTIEERARRNNEVG